MRCNRIDPDRYTLEHPRPRTAYTQLFHVEPRTGLLNDPHGLIFYGGQYHLFYQTHPFAPEHGVKYWFHLTSPDLVRWREEGFALKPEYWYEIDGCCSGSAIEREGRLYLFYTGKILDDKGEFLREQYQAAAVSDDGRAFQKQPQPLIGPPEGDFSAHFRDPKVWEHGGSYYMLLAAQTKDRLPQILGYRSRDLADWEPLGVLGGVDYRFGYMWECPGFCRVDGRDVLLVCPQGATFSNNPLANSHQSGCLVGDMDYQAFAFPNGGYQPLDSGFEYYASYAYNAPDGRALCVGWLGLPGNYPTPTHPYGYAHCLSIPTELSLQGNRLCRRPAAEAASLFGPPEEPRREVGAASFRGAAYRLRYETGRAPEKAVTLLLRGDGQGGGLSVRIDPGRDLLVVDRSRTISAGAEVRELSLPLSGGIKLDLLMDISSFELFVNNGEHVLSGRYYVDREWQENRVTGLDEAGRLTVARYAGEKSEF